MGALLPGGIAGRAGFAWSLGVDAVLLGAAALGRMLLVRETAGRRAGRTAAGWIQAVPVGLGARR